MHSISSCVTAISESVHGTRAMQTLVEVIAHNIVGLDSACQALITELNVDMLAISTNANSNHVL